jgi:Ca2+-binding RTX toxin-like protein
MTTSDIHVVTSSPSSTIAFGDRNALVWDATAGGKTLQGGAGIDLLFAGKGVNDTLLGGGGDDFLFGGKGADRLAGAAGSDFLKGGAGADVFVFAASEAGTDTVGDFARGVDKIEIRSSSGVTAASLIAGATTQADGSAVLHLSPQNHIVLENIKATELQAGWFQFG